MVDFPHPLGPNKMFKPGLSLNILFPTSGRSFAYPLLIWQCVNMMLVDELCGELPDTQFLGPIFRMVALIVSHPGLLCELSSSLLDEHCHVAGSAVVDAALHPLPLHWASLMNS